MSGQETLKFSTLDLIIHNQVYTPWPDKMTCTFFLAKNKMVYLQHCLNFEILGILALVKDTDGCPNSAFFIMSEISILLSKDNKCIIRSAYKG